MKIPNALVILFLMIAIIAVATWLIPAGNFVRSPNPDTGIVMVEPGSYARAEQDSPVGIFGTFLCIQKGFVETGSIIFLIFFAYFCVLTVTKTGTMHAAINALLKLLHGKESLLIPTFMIIFALAGSTYGEWDTIYGLIPIFVGLAVAVGYDAMVGLAMSGMAVAIGFASATTNPFTIGIAQAIAELPIFSGLLYRGAAFVVFTGVGIWWTMRYAAKVKKDPSQSLVAGVDLGSMVIDRSTLEQSEFTPKRKVTLALLFATIIFIVYSTLKLGWYLDEMSAIFLMSGVVISIYWKLTPDEIADNLVQACRELMLGALVTGLSRGVLVVMREGNILDTIIHAMYQPLQHLPTWLAAEGMLVFQNVMNFFIPSGSGQAAAVMPIMVPLADLVGISRQVAVLAYQFGDGYSNLFWPTGGIIIMTTIAHVPLNKWYRFFAPLFGIMLALQAIFVAVAVAINYGPF